MAINRENGRNKGGQKMSKTEVLMTIIGAVFSSVGFWTFVNNVYQNIRDKQSAERRALLGLLHEKLSERASFFIAKGSITRVEYEDFIKYVYEPYVGLGGNGTGEKLKQEVDDLRMVG